MLSKKSTKLAIAICVLAIVQSLVWIILCFLGILIHFQVLLIFTRRTTHNERYTYWLYMVFAGQDTKMVFILFLYLLLSVMWICISITLIISIRNKQKNKTRLSFLLWGEWTILICLFDLVVLGLIAYDYSKVIDVYNTSPSLRVMFSLIAYGTLFSLAARGYALWVINLTLAIVVIKHAKGSKKKNYTGELINAFDERNKRISDRGGELNEGYEQEANTPPLLERSNSYASGLHGYPKQQPYRAAPPKPYYNNCVATIGRQRPRQQAPSVIPKPPKPPIVYVLPRQQVLTLPIPDYSPPSSPLKSAMQNRQMQNPFDFNRTSNNRY